MNLLQTMLARSKSSNVDSDHLPEVNAFVDVAIGGKTESLPVESLARKDFRVRRHSKVAVGCKALFNYVNARGGFRFYAECIALEDRAAVFAMPAEIVVINEFGEKRHDVRLKCNQSVVWRYAPGGVGYGEFSESVTADISTSGMLLVMPRELKAGTQVEIKINLGGSFKPFSVIGDLTRPSSKQPSGKFLGGIAFKNISPTNANAVGEFIASRQIGTRKRSLAAAR